MLLRGGGLMHHFAHCFLHSDLHLKSHWFEGCLLSVWWLVVPLLPPVGGNTDFYSNVVIFVTSPMRGR